MSELATVSDVEAVTGTTITDATRVQRLIVMATAMVRTYTGQTISEVEDDSIEIRPDRYGNLRLPQRPVTDIASITVDGALIDPTLYEFDSNGVIVASSFNEWELNGPITWAGPATVVYTHGYNPNPADVAMVVAEMVAGVISSPGGSGSGISRTRVDDVEVAYTAGAAAGSLRIADHHVKILDRYKRPAVSIDMVSRRR